MQITCSFRIYPTLEQAAKLNNWLNLCRKLYNLALEERQTRWKTEKKSISYKDQRTNCLPSKKKILNTKRFIPRFCKMLCVE